MWPGSRGGVCVSKGETMGGVGCRRDQGSPGQLTETLGTGGGLRNTCVCVCLCAVVSWGELGSVVNKMDCVSNSYWRDPQCIYTRTSVPAAGVGPWPQGSYIQLLQLERLGSKHSYWADWIAGAWLLEGFTWHMCCVYLSLYLSLSLSLYLFLLKTFMLLSQRAEQDDAIGAGFACAECVPMWWSGWADGYIYVCVCWISVFVCMCLLGIHAEAWHWLDLGEGAAATLPLWGCWIRQPLTLRTFKWQLSKH